MWVKCVMTWIDYRTLSCTRKGLNLWCMSIFQLLFACLTRKTSAALGIFISWTSSCRTHKNQICHRRSFLFARQKTLTGNFLCMHTSFSLCLRVFFFFFWRIVRSEILDDYSRQHKAKKPSDPISCSKMLHCSVCRVKFIGVTLEICMNSHVLRV